MFNDITPQGDLGNVRADYANGTTLTTAWCTRQDVRPGLVADHRERWDDVTGVGSVTGRYLNSLPSFRH